MVPRALWKINVAYTKSYLHVLLTSLSAKESTRKEVLTKNRRHIFVVVFSFYQLRWLCRHAFTASVSCDKKGCITERWEASGDFIDEILEFQRNSVRRILVYGKMGTNLLLRALLTEKIIAVSFQLFSQVCLSNLLLWDLCAFCTKWTRRSITLVVSYLHVSAREPLDSFWLSWIWPF
jgi:hypothetical protein